MTEKNTPKKQVLVLRLDDGLTHFGDPFKAIKFGEMFCGKIVPVDSKVEVMAKPAPGETTAQIRRRCDPVCRVCVAIIELKTL